MPLSDVDIKIEMMRRGDSLSKLARKWKVEPAVISRVIHRREPFVYPEIRAKLAKYMNVPVSEVGRPFASPEDEERLIA